MDDLMKLALEQTPSLAVLVFLVVYFIRYIQGRDKDNQEMAEHMSKVIEKNSEVIGGVSEVIRKCDGLSK